LFYMPMIQMLFVQILVLKTLAWHSTKGNE
jgi:hypothetical protein